VRHLWVLAMASAQSTLKCESMSERKEAVPQGTAPTYSIGEWYGQGFEKLSPIERYSLARSLAKSGGHLKAPCPFLAGADCNKKGGVCSLRNYEESSEAGVAFCSGPLVTTCPRRFQEDGLIFQWVGEVILGTRTPIVLREIPFLEDSGVGSRTGSKKKHRKYVGKIDNVLVNPSRSPLDWCALEQQAVYFSGDAMTLEFQTLSRKNFESLPLPSGRRHPDWRSSGPKRLLPQLQTKVRRIRTWGKKMAVVVDEAFFESLAGMKLEEHVSNAEILWFVVGYEPAPRGWRLVPRRFVSTMLDSSVDALTGGKPLSKEAFELLLQSKLLAEQKRGSTPTKRQ